MRMRGCKRAELPITLMARAALQPLFPLPHSWGHLIFIIQHCFISHFCFVGISRIFEPTMSIPQDWLEQNLPFQTEPSSGTIISETGVSDEEICLGAVN